MPKYMLLLHEDPSNFANFSPEEMQTAIMKYRAWTQKAFVVDSNRLGEDPGRVIRSGDGKPRVTDGPYSETKEFFAGYYTVEAASYDEAIELAMDHPHLEYRGTIEVRALWVA